MEDANKILMVLEYCDRGDLKKYIYKNNNRGFKDAEICDIITQISKGLKYCHDLEPPLVHCDIKPENILYNSIDKKYKIIDFDNAKQTQGGSFRNTDDLRSSYDQDLDNYDVDESSALHKK